MSQIAYANFCMLIANLSEELSAHETIAAVRERYRRQLEEITPQIVENAIINIRRNVLRRRACLHIEGHGDLFEGYSVPSKISLPASGERKAKRVSPDKLTKAELRALIDELRQRPPKKNKRLVELERMYSDIDAHCADDEDVGVGLRRLKRV